MRYRRGSAGIRSEARPLSAAIGGPAVLGTVYDSTFGSDDRNFLGVPAAVARANHQRVNDVIATLAARHGRLADLHAHFLSGEPSWFVQTIEPSLIGASEVRRVFWACV